MLNQLKSAGEFRLLVFQNYFKKPSHFIGLEIRVKQDSNLVGVQLIHAEKILLMFR